MARIVGAAQAIADRELGGHDASVLIESLLSMSDFKGDFTVIWRLPTHNEGFEKVVDRALALMGEDEVLHLLESDQ